jgi:hypothetical protein
MSELPRVPHVHEAAVAGEELPGKDPLVKSHATYFAPAGMPRSE